VPALSGDRNQRDAWREAMALVAWRAKELEEPDHDPADEMTSGLAVLCRVEGIDFFAARQAFADLLVQTADAPGAPGIVSRASVEQRWEWAEKTAIPMVIAALSMPVFERRSDA
jgi:hypothetical protein